MTDPEIGVTAPPHKRIAMRFGTTLVANALRMALSFASWLVIARGLGAARYGDLTFLLGSFAAINLLLDMGTSHGFHTLVSRRRRGPAFFAVYLLWTIGVQLAGTLLTIWLLLPEPVVRAVWLGQDRSLVLLAFAVSFMTTQMWAMVSQMGEALRKTVFVQSVAVAQAAAHLALVWLAVDRGWLTIASVCWLFVIEYVIVTLLVGPRLLRSNLADQSDARDTAGSVIREFAEYCRPLAWYAGAAVLYQFADRWLLQQFGGARQQGFFSIGQQIASISLLATTSVLDVFWKEIAEARERKDHALAGRLYARVRHTLYFVAAWVSCLLVPYCAEILSWSVGTDYRGALLPLAIMLMYPVHQSLSLVQGTFAYANNQPEAYSRVGIYTMMLSIPVTYLLLAPADARVAGLGLGAVGVASKLVLLQIIGTSWLAVVLARTNGWPLDFGFQALLLGALLTLAVACRGLAMLAAGAAGQAGSLVVPILGGAAYAVLSLAAVYRWPSVAGVTREQIRWAVSLPARWFNPETTAA